MIDVNMLRNVAILSHAGAGKTSLAEAFLFNTKVINRLGNVGDGNTVSDYEPEEVRRAGSIQTALIPCTWGGHKLNLLDTPGYDDDPPVSSSSEDSSPGCCGPTILAGMTHFANCSAVRSPRLSAASRSVVPSA